MGKRSKRGRVKSPPGVLIPLDEDELGSYIQAEYGLSKKKATQILDYISADLDDTVHETASDIAAYINNSGLESQIDYILSACALSEEDLRLLLHVSIKEAVDLEV